MKASADRLCFDYVSATHLYFGPGACFPRQVEFDQTLHRDRCRCRVKRLRREDFEGSRSGNANHRFSANGILRFPSDSRAGVNPDRWLTAEAQSRGEDNSPAFVRQIRTKSISRDAARRLIVSYAFPDELRGNHSETPVNSRGREATDRTWSCAPDRSIPALPGAGLSRSRMTRGIGWNWFLIGPAPFQTEPRVNTRRPEMSTARQSNRKRITPTFQLPDIAKACNRFGNRADGVLKVTVCP